MTTSTECTDAAAPDSPQASAELQELDLAIIGGGISGLATAYYAQQSWRGAANPRLRYAVFERSPHAGGKIQTEVVDTGAESPFIVEAGPDSFLTQKPWALSLARELGMEAELMGTNDHLRRVFVLQGERLVPMPEGLQLIVPTHIWPFVRSPLLSPWGKLRMGLDLVLPRKRDDEDETLADFVTRRLGREALDKLAEPLMSGIYSAEADRQSILATFPRFRELERAHGSLIRGILAAGRSRQQTVATAPSGKKLAAFVTPVQGTAAFVRRLCEALGDHVRCEVEVTRLEANGSEGYRLILQSGAQVNARAVVLATPAGVTARLLHALAPESAARLASIRHVSTVTLTVAYRAEDVPHPMDGFGVMIPRSEQRPINAITWTSSKFDHRAPAGYRLIRVFLGGSRNPQIIARGDADLLQIAQNQLAQILGITAAPLFHRLFRWQDASPQYDVGHLDLVDAIEAGLPQNLYVTGSPYRGIGIPDCVHQAQNTARQVVQALEIA